MQAPKYLDKIAREHWKQVTEMLTAAGTINDADVDALAVYCTLYSRWREAEVKIRTHGAVNESCTRKSPWYIIATETIAALKNYQDRFGLSPAARAKLLLKPSEDDPLQDFLKGVG